ncbi:hypothetical protein MMC25_004618 [Agyrium rufum]|nr:hypothetical protein [Agyrium rufum]
MDMSEMDMSGMSGGMDMGSNGLFKDVNMMLARAYWYIIASVVALLSLLRVARHLRTRWSIRTFSRRPDAVPSRPTNLLSQSLATITAICREMSYGQPLTFTGRFSKYFSPPSTGRILILSAYWIVLLSFLWTNVILKPNDPLYGYKWEKVGFRAAWISVTQVPFIVLLSCKLNPISILTGISYERLNWFHRWAARTLFFTIIVHWSFFFREWYIANFVQLEIGMMPMVKFGFGTWAVLGWTIITSWGYFRGMSYEIFVLQHLTAAGIFLWLLYSHVPVYAQYNVWMAIGFVVFDQVGRLSLNIIRNVNRSSGKGMMPNLGYRAHVEALPGSFTKVTINDVKFKWKAGQHVYISIPRCGFMEAHPFTVASVPDSLPSQDPQNLSLIIKSHGGFTKKLHARASQPEKQPLRAFVSGPWGYPPNLASYETLILIAASTGATFTVPILSEIALSTENCVRNVVFCWVCRDASQITWFQREISAAAQALEARGVSVTIKIVITACDPCLCNSKHAEPEQTALLASDNQSEGEIEKGVVKTHVSAKSISSQSHSSSSDSSATSSSSISEKHGVSATISPSEMESQTPKPPESGLANPTPKSCSFCLCSFKRRRGVSFTTGSRPTLDGVIRPAVENALGETAVVACGGRELMADVRNYVVRLSDERAVHKGTGAQGIMLFTEMFDW